MKLYTEEQVMEAYHIGEDDGNWGRYREDVVALKLTPIELPSDEEIDKFAQIASSIREEKTQGEWIAYKSVIAGAKWVINQIKQQDNGK